MRPVRRWLPSAGEPVARDQLCTASGPREDAQQWQKPTAWFSEPWASSSLLFGGAGSQETGISGRTQQAAAEEAASASEKAQRPLRVDEGRSPPGGDRG